MPSRASASNAPVYPLAAPALYLYAKPGKDWFLRGGLYTSNAGEDVVSNIGVDWRIGGDAGYSIILEFGIESALFGLPATYKLGGLYNTANLSKLGANETVKGNVDIYVVADQALWVDARDKPILSAFVRVGSNPLKDRTEVGLHAGTGLNYFGPFGRSDDAVGIAVSYNRFTTAFVQATDEQMSEHETILELTYQAVLTPWLTLQPDLQLIFDPVFSRRNAYVIMMQAEINF